MRDDKTITPIGGTMAWFGSIVGCPTLPDGWQLCDGGAITDTRSPMLGANTPDLNSGSNRMLRGNTTSGATGGLDTHTLDISEIPAHDHGYTNYPPAAGFAYGSPGPNDILGAGATTGSTGGGGAHNNLPGYTEAIIIIRIF